MAPFSSLKPLSLELGDVLDSSLHDEFGSLELVSGFEVHVVFFISGFGLKVVFSDSKSKQGEFTLRDSLVTALSIFKFVDYWMFAETAGLSSHFEHIFIW